MVDGEFEQVVFDPALRAAAEAKNLRTSTLAQEVETILARADSEERSVFAYSMHEHEVVDRYTVLGRRLRKRYRNVLKIARRWLDTRQRSEITLNREGRPRWKNDQYRTQGAKEWALINFLKFIGNPPPPHLGTAKTTKRLRAVIKMLETRHDEYDRMTPTVKAGWTKLLDHNKHDCHGIRSLMIRISDETDNP